LLSQAKLGLPKADRRTFGGPRGITTNGLKSKVRGLLAAGKNPEKKKRTKQL